MIGNGGRGRRRVRLRLMQSGWHFLARPRLVAWVGPYGSAQEAFAVAQRDGHLWYDEERRKR